MSSNFDKQLESILKGDVDKLVDDLPEDEKEESIPEEMLPVEFDKRESSLALDNKDLQEDYEYARSNLYGLVGKSNAALELTLKIAMMSEHPRALEVAANLIKTSSDISKELMSLHKQLNDNKGGKQEPPAGKYVQNNYYGETKEKTEELIDNLPDEDDEKDEK